jgi:pantoate--beta-alanine ligase
MIIFKTIPELRQFLQKERETGQSIGFIPTMGALHKGHISLINKSKEDGCFSVCSIFVNPAQFNDPGDFDKYPSTLAQDIQLLEEAGCEVLFLPAASEIYPNGMDAANVYHFGSLESVFEGAMRPGHFAGVGKVVAILLNIVVPDALFMGAKDYQQCLVVKDLCRQLGMSGIRFVSCPTRREPDGLAMSSRNLRLNESQRARAGIIYQCLVSLQEKFLSGADFGIAQKECLDLLQAKGFSTEYVSIANADTLEPLTQFDSQRKTIALIAAKIGDIRLIDNMLLN